MYGADKEFDSRLENEITMLALEDKEVRLYSVRRSVDEMLCTASYNGHFTLVKLLVEKVSSKYHYSTALVWAASKGYMEIAKLLLTVYTNVNELKEASIRMIAECGQVEAMKLLFDSGLSKTKINSHVIDTAYKYNRYGMIELFKEYGINAERN